MATTTATIKSEIFFRAVSFTYSQQVAVLKDARENHGIKLRIGLRSNAKLIDAELRYQGELLEAKEKEAATVHTTPREETSMIVSGDINSGKSVEATATVNAIKTESKITVINPMPTRQELPVTLEQKIEWSFKVFDQLDQKSDYLLSFSGGKDSHVLLGIYVHWSYFRQKKLNLTVTFADTLLETEHLYALIKKTEDFCRSNQITFKREIPLIEKNFWVVQFGLGYPVPNYRARWCTKFLKVQPMQRNKGIGLTGSHYGESITRDKRLNNCGSSECGINELSNTIEPLTIWRNCDIWDWIVLYSDNVLYKGVSDNLLSMYQIAESEQSSLRMGCFMCPVVSNKTIQKNVDQGIVPAFSIGVRMLLEELRVEPRINSEKTKKAGAILVDSRIKVWEKMKQFVPQLLENNWITQEVVDLVDLMLSKRTYPQTYKREWIEAQELLIKNQLSW